MPSKSTAQHNLMEGVAHNPKFAAKVGIPQKVGQDFAAADAKRGGPPMAKQHALVKALRKPSAGY